jgi:probable phosphoglycerate mutase
MPAKTQEVYLVCDDDTGASPTGQRFRPVLAGTSFTLVLTSPLRGARESCEQAALAARAVVDPSLGEWRDGDGGSETPAQVAARVDRVIARVREVEGNVVLFAHDHVLRAFLARWLALPVAAAERFILSSGTLNILAYYGDAPAVKIWNAPLALMR